MEGCGGFGAVARGYEGADRRYITKHRNLQNAFTLITEFQVKLLPDGACLFTRGMGMSCTWESERGFGERSWRYSAVIDDGKVEKLFIEPNREQNSGPDPFEVSDATTMVNYLKSK